MDACITESWKSGRMYDVLLESVFWSGFVGRLTLGTQISWRHLMESGIVSFLFMVGIVFFCKDAPHLDWWLCFEGYLGNAWRRSTGKPSGASMFHLICDWVDGNFEICACAFWCRWHETFFSQFRDSQIVWKFRPTAWCEDNVLFLNASRCKTITFSRSRHLIELFICWIRCCWST
jgi:hypothetical protein